MAHCWRSSDALFVNYVLLVKLALVWAHAFTYPCASGLTTARGESLALAKVVKNSTGATIGGGVVELVTRTQMLTASEHTARLCVCVCASYCSFATSHVIHK